MADPTSPLQTKVPVKLQPKLKAYGVGRYDYFYEFLEALMLEFIEKKPWLNGYHIRQPDARRSPHPLKPFMFWVKTEIAETVTEEADKLGVSTSSFAYTALMWWWSLHPDAENEANQV